MQRILVISYRRFRTTYRPSSISYWCFGTTYWFHLHLDPWRWEK